MMREEFAIVHFLKSAKRGSPQLWWSSVVMLIGMVLCFALPFIDARLIAGVNVWEKPAKFFLSLVVQAITVAWAISLVSHKMRGVKTATWIFIFASWFETAYIFYRASRGEASHFNQTSVFAIIMYALMGVGAVLLVVTSAFVGWRIWQQRGDSLMREAASVGLILGAALGLFAGAYLSSHTSHWIGGDMSDATGLPFFHWSTTGGDLRVAHFIGLHTAQAVPLAALSGNRVAVYSAALVMVLAMAGAFAMAVMGIPLFRA
jgi:hypothetical protein